MPYEGYIAPLPIGTLGLTQRDNRRQQQAGELIQADAITFADNSLRKEPGASAYDSAGAATAPVFTGTLAGSDAWAGIMKVFYGAGIAVGGTATGATKVTGGGGTTLAVTVPAGGYALGSLVIVAITTLSTVHGAWVSGISDTRGNTYTAVGSTYALANGLVTAGDFQLFYSVLTTALLVNDVISIAQASDKSAAAAVANYTSTQAWSVDTRLRVNRSTVNTTAVSVGPHQTLKTVPALIVCGLGSTAQTDTPGSGFTEQREENGGATSGVASVNHRIDTTSPGIIAMYDWRSEVQTTPAGTVSTTAGDTTVTGVGTTFTNHAPGDKIIVNAEQQIISSITNNTSLETVDAWRGTNAGVAYSRRVGGRLITATMSGNIYKDKPASLTTTNIDDTTLVSSLSLYARPGRFVQGGKEAASDATNPRKLFYFNGVNPIQVLAGDGTTMAAIATPPTDWSASANPFQQPVNGCIHNNRLVGWGNLNDPHRLYFSDPDNHENFTSASAFNLRVASSIGERLWCGVDYMGVLFLWKYPRGIFYLDDTDLTASNWFIRTKSESLGCAPSPYAVLPLDDDVLFMAADGQFHMLSAVDTLGGVSTSNLSKALGIRNYIRDHVNLARLDRVVSCWNPDQKLAYFAVPGTGETTNTLLLKFDFSQQPVKFSVSTRDSTDAIILKRFDDTLIHKPISGEAGFVWLLDQDARTKNGEEYTSTVQTAHETFGYVDPKLANIRKLFDHLELEFEPVASGEITVYVYVDNVLRQTITNFDPTERSDRKKLNCGDGNEFSIKITCEEGDFNLIGANVYFRSGNEDYSR